MSVKVAYIGLALFIVFGGVSTVALIALFIGVY